MTSELRFALGRPKGSLLTVIGSSFFLIAHYFTPKLGQYREGFGKVVGFG